MPSAVDLDVGVPGAQDRVVAQQVRHHLGGPEVVGGHEVDVGTPLLGRSEEVAADAAESVDADADGHREVLLRSLVDVRPSEQIPPLGSSPTGRAVRVSARAPRARDRAWSGRAPARWAPRCRPPRPRTSMAPRGSAPECTTVTSGGCHGAAGRDVGGEVVPEGLGDVGAQVRDVGHRHAGRRRWPGGGRPPLRPPERSCRASPGPRSDQVGARRWPRSPARRRRARRHRSTPPRARASSATATWPSTTRAAVVRPCSTTASSVTGTTRARRRSIR